RLQGGDCYDTLSRPTPKYQAERLSWQRVDVVEAIGARFVHPFSNEPHAMSGHTGAIGADEAGVWYAILVPIGGADRCLEVAMAERVLPVALFSRRVAVAPFPEASQSTTRAVLCVLARLPRD
ncbi:hypothetical protein JG688_00006376, partial [Phytophthora aleatoria]